MSEEQREPLRMLVVSASLRERSLNNRLARLAAEALERHGVAVDLASMPGATETPIHAELADGLDARITRLKSG